MNESDDGKDENFNEEPVPLAFCTVPTFEDHRMPVAPRLTFTTIFTTEAVAPLSNPNSIRTIAMQVVRSSFLTRSLARSTLLIPHTTESRADKLNIPFELLALEWNTALVLLHD
ncbi:hypothetical protein Moror_11078 [Moniliophthora roreri MCA 2997]|uniref:Uncharacterized protein n=1 Tax=Moniliophthora roreri (strain MCA 2997) TaxID=1381753 RepID=V2WUL9_MONRO|nr:hypothetical protein Moror_11078 [Moniliophthora roreri MCA 2997]